MMAQGEEGCPRLIMPSSFSDAPDMYNLLDTINDRILHAFLVGTCLETQLQNKRWLLARMSPEYIYQVVCQNIVRIPYSREEVANLMQNILHLEQHQAPIDSEKHEIAGECVVCAENVSKRELHPWCSTCKTRQPVHAACLSEWLCYKFSCPTCRNPLQMIGFWPIDPEEIEEECGYSEDEDGEDEDGEEGEGTEEGEDVWEDVTSEDEEGDEGEQVMRIQDMLEAGFETEEEDGAEEAEEEEEEGAEGAEEAEEADFEIELETENMLINRDNVVFTIVDNVTDPNQQVRRRRRRVRIF